MTDTAASLAAGDIAKGLAAIAAALNRIAGALELIVKKMNEDES